MIKSFKTKEYDKIIKISLSKEEIQIINLHVYL